MRFTSICRLLLVMTGWFVSCKQTETISNTNDSVKVNTNLPAAPVAGDYEIEEDSILIYAARQPIVQLEDLPIQRVGELILKDSVKTLHSEVIAFMLLDSLNAATRTSRNFYFKVFNKIMDRSIGAMSDAIGDYALSYVEAYPNEFLANSVQFSTSRLETWASQIGIELFLSPGDPKEAFQNSTDAFQRNCKGCGAAEMERLQKFNALIWSTIEQNIAEKQP